MGNSHGKPVVFTNEGTSTPSIIVPRASWRPEEDRPYLGEPFHRCRRPGIKEALLKLTTNVCDLVNLNHFRLLRVVGKGAFGKVRIVERKDTGLTFALKYIRKDEGSTPHCSRRDSSSFLTDSRIVVRSESVRNIIRERRMLEHLNHPFLCNLRYSFQDIEYLYVNHPKPHHGMHKHLTPGIDTSWLTL